MVKFLVNSGLLPGTMEPLACALAVPKMLRDKGIKDVKVKNCYCCGPAGKVVFVTEAPNKDTLVNALSKIELPVESVMETEEVQPK